MIESFILSIFYAIWIFLPAGLANAAPVIAAKVPGTEFLNKPIDFGKSIRGIRIFGDHKTFRGYVFGILVAIIATVTQYLIIQNVSFIESNLPEAYLGSNPIILGFLLGFGALAGDSVKSFFKRRVGVKSGQSWFPFDQLDYILGGLLLVGPYLGLAYVIYIEIVIIWFLLHLFFTFLGFLLKLKDSPI